MHEVAQDVTARAGGRAMRADTLHLTLAFLGDIAADRVPAALAAGDAVATAWRKGRAAAVAPLLDRLGYWPHNGVVWAGCGMRDAALDRLAAALCETLAAAGFALESRRFAPHVTLVRKAGEAGNFPALAAQRWQGRELVLVHSRRSAAGADYERLAAWPLE